MCRFEETVREISVGQKIYEVVVREIWVEIGTRLEQMEGKPAGKPHLRLSRLSGFQLSLLEW